MDTIINKLKSASLEGVNAKVVEVEGSFTKGLPSFNIVGLASSDIQEAKERAKSALLTNSLELPPLRITINLSPSDIKKQGTHFDLAIALMIALFNKKISHQELFIFGELGLDGKVKGSSLIFPLILSLKEQNLIKDAIVPKETLSSLQYIKGVNFIGVDNIKEAIEVIKSPSLPKSKFEIKDFSKNSITINNTPYYFLTNYPLDFKEVKGQYRAIRAALIAAAGNHNIILNGNPGSGKSMIAKRLQYILPPLSSSEILSIAKATYLDNKEPKFKPIRPFRSPHHSATPSAIFGGGSNRAKIGEVALANLGILFFDELPHFHSKVLEALREPLQDRVINIARVNSKLTYEANFLFIGAMNPCPCGNLLSKNKVCRCSESEIKRYKNRLSDPFLDRIELFVTMQEVEFSDRAHTSSKELHKSVIKAFIAQKQRGQKELNGKLNEKEIEKYCILEEEAKDILEEATLKFSLSHRAIANIKKVARTIADLNENSLITKKDILEALSYRKRD
ncbi:MAG: YifB family Mg chelatase-like AAA ATPase [Epsilonproteobacteria bacterium]|nr:YifB family Mg chelatase-like AAA ATPase [Campylobacterota bacterium]